MELLLNLISEYLEYILFGGMVFVSFHFITRKQKQQKFARKILDKTIKSGMNEPLTLHPEINSSLCGGCASCTKVCPEGDILRMINHKAVLVNPTKCVGHGECERACPYGAIDLVFGTKTRGVDIPRVSSDYETNVPGLYIAGELGGMGLIRNAIKQGNLAASHAIKNLKDGQADVDLLIVGAGPGGIACGLTAITKKVSYKVLEQNSMGGTVYNFPRQKVVMTHPAELPGFGLMKFSRNKVSKEELLEYWTAVRKKSGLKVSEGVKFDNLEKKGDVFYVETSKGTIKAKKVILCMGVRGSPRKLGLPNEDTSKVAYNLVDPEQYQSQHIAVVGGGNAGVEAAQMLANPKYGNKVKLLVRGDQLDRCNDENKAIIFDMEKKGQVEIKWNTVVSEIHPEKLILETDGKKLEVPNHYLFVFAGAIMPHKFLMSLGIEIDKSFGDRKMKSA
ncbi:MAG: NAD(P)-binding domain-containing protein [Bdellovibrionales bacterium]|nr:NAD(P)-binding domain-containing protein [Bdellovibrionales bacterium]